MNYQQQELEDAEKLVQCPYNPAHYVVNHRLGRHLIKCRKTANTAGTSECRFNVTHILPSSEIKFHESICPDRIIVESFLNQQKNHNAAPKTETTPGKWDD